VTGPVHGSLLSDGYAVGVWRIDRDADGGATLVVDVVERLPRRAAAGGEAEGRRLLGVLAADAGDPDVRVVVNP
jgi:hypothetical protein